MQFTSHFFTGGCKLTCGERLACGHFCERNCHFSDRRHEQYQCLKDCTRLLQPCGHSCPGNLYYKLLECI